MRDRGSHVLVPLLSMQNMYLKNTLRTSTCNCSYGVSSYRSRGAKKNKIRVNTTGKYSKYKNHRNKIISVRAKLADKVYFLYFLNYGYIIRDNVFFNFFFFL